MDLNELYEYIEDASAGEHEHKLDEGHNCVHCQAMALVDHLLAIEQSPGRKDVMRALGRYRAREEGSSALLSSGISLAAAVDHWDEATGYFR